MSYMLKLGNVKFPAYFTFNYNDKRGIELEFRPRKNKEEQVRDNTIR
jgi:hypothetical protein